MTNYIELKRLAEHAFNGPWTFTEIDPDDKSWGACELQNKDGAFIATHVCGVFNASYIAAASPDVVLSMIAEIDRLKELLAGKFDDISLSYAGEFFGVEGFIAPMLIEMFAKQFKESHAGNYLEMSFKSAQILPSETFVVRVQKVAGKTPHQLRLEAEEQRDTLRTQLQHAQMAAEAEAKEVDERNAVIDKLRTQNQSLREALKDLKRQYSEHPDAFWDWSKARAALALAEGGV